MFTAQADYLAFTELTRSLSAPHALTLVPATSFQPDRLIGSPNKLTGLPNEEFWVKKEKSGVLFSRQESRLFV
jgi:hypothetical protein